MVEAMAQAGADVVVWGSNPKKNAEGAQGAGQVRLGRQPARSAATAGVRSNSAMLRSPCASACGLVCTE